MKHDVFISLRGLTDDGDARHAGFAHLEEVITDADIKFSVENNGIGAYEYWGARCYDAGTDYAVIDSADDINVAVCIEGFDPAELDEGETLEDWVRELIPCELNPKRVIDLHPNHDYYEAAVEAEAKFTKVAEEIAGDKAVVVFAVEWETDGEIC
jgi:hypothetical protein